MTNKSFFKKRKAHVNKKKHECECQDVMDRLNEDIKNFKTIIDGYKHEPKKVERD